MQIIQTWTTSLIHKLKQLARLAMYNYIRPPSSSSSSSSVPPLHLSHLPHFLLLPLHPIPSHAPLYRVRQKPHTGDSWKDNDCWLVREPFVVPVYTHVPSIAHAHVFPVKFGSEGRKDTGGVLLGYRLGGINIHYDHLHTNYH